MHCHFQSLKVSPCVIESGILYFPESLGSRILLYIATVTIVFLYSIIQREEYIFPFLWRLQGSEQTALISFLGNSFDSPALVLQGSEIITSDFLQCFLVTLYPAEFLPGLCLASSLDVSIKFPVLNLFPGRYLE